MLSSESGRQPRRARGRVQAEPGTGSGTSGLRFRLAPAAPAALALLLAGCSSYPSSLNPVTWWHDLQGGKIAEQRPPPPGADQPYPNLASVPPKPAEPDRAALTNLSNGLIADRINAQHAAAVAPLPDPSSPSASPSLFGKGSVPPPPPPPPPGTKTASASLPAAEAPPAPAGPSAAAEAPAPPPAKAPVGAVQSAPLAPPSGGAAPAAAEAAAPPPPLPTAPPPPPRLPGVAQSPTPSAPAPAPAPPPPPVAAAAPPPAPPSPPPPAASPPPAAPAVVATATPASPPAPASPANTVSITFITGSAVLPPSASDTLKQLAARRGNGIIAVTGYGDATSNDPAAQSTALTLGLSRAQAMAAALTSAGVPPTAVQVDAVAIGRGGTARLVQ